MNLEIPRLRMFAGPNGSGKSTIKDVINKELLGISRYYRSLDYLQDAVKLSDRAYIFDNSSYEKTWICEITDGSAVDMKVDIAPKWVYHYLLDKKMDVIR